jgi:hypothetical protein
MWLHPFKIHIQNEDCNVNAALGLNQLEMMKKTSWGTNHDNSLKPNRIGKNSG